LKAIRRIPPLASDGHALSFIEFAKAFTRRGDKIDALQDFLPSSISRELLNSLYGYFLNGHLSTPLDVMPVSRRPDMERYDEGVTNLVM